MNVGKLQPVSPPSMPDDYGLEAWFDQRLMKTR
jgi:hypothetical protein